MSKILKMKNFESIEEKVIFMKLTENDLKINQNKIIECLETKILLMIKEQDNFAFRHISSHRRFIGKFIIFTKRTIRKILKWYIEPICFQQTRFNKATVNSLKETSKLIEEIYNQNQKLKQENEYLKNEIMTRLSIKK